jgi:hypothetical protein
MPLFLNAFATGRPNRLEDVKDKEYHVKYARWALGAFSHPLHSRFITKSLINWNFYKGGDGQWIFDEDLESFFMDESGDIKNRLKISKNLIRPMVEQYVGNAIRLAFSARAVNASEFVINRREQGLAKLNFLHDIKELAPNLGRAVDQIAPLGKDREETKEIFLNSFIDEHQENLNNMLKYIEKDVEIEELKVQATKHLAITGLCIYKGFEHNHRYNAEVIDPLFFVFDRGAVKPDLSDAEYMGDWSYMDAPSVFERWQNISAEERMAIEKFSQNESINVHKVLANHYNITPGRIPIYEMYWRDTEQQEYGWVEDLNGYPFFTRINHEDSDFTDVDLIEAPSDIYKKRLGGKKKKKIFVDTLRYCVFIPKEEIATTSQDDIVLEFGELPFQEKYKFDISNVSFPYKCGTWAYDKGEILSPIDDAIQPQRFINRLLSVTESHINNARGSSTVIAKDAVDPKDGEAGVMRALNRSKPIFVDTARTGSVQNTVGTVEPNISAGTMGLFNVIREMQSSLQDITGINEALTGTLGASNALVGVVQQQIQRGTLIQEPFYFALTNMMKQAYEHMSSVGRRVYAESPRRLAIIGGDGGAQEIQITNEMKHEDMRIFIDRVADDATLTESGNNMIMLLLQTGLLDSKNAANLFGRSTPNEIADALREHQRNLSMAEKLQREQQAAQMQQLGQAQQEEQLKQDAKEKEEKLSEEIQKEKDRQLEIEKIERRTQGQLKRDRAKREETGGAF